MAVRNRDRPEWVQDATWLVPATSEALVEIPEDWSDTTIEDLRKSVCPWWKRILNRLRRVYD